MIEQPPIQPTPVGALRFNTDNAKLEYFDGNQYVNITTDSPERHTGGTRGLFVGGRNPANSDTIDFVSIDTTGNAVDFGNRLEAGRQGGATGSRVRGVICGRPVPLHSNIIEFLTFASTGNTQDFGDSTNVRAGAPMSISNGTRGVFAGGEIDSSGTVGNIIDYVTIAQTGNAVDFGDLNIPHSDGGRGQSPTRGVFSGGRGPDASTRTNAMEYITTATLGNTSDFGDLTTGRNEIGADSNAVRAIFAGGNTGSVINVIDFITIATLANAQDFGDLSSNSTETRGSASPTRFVISLGSTPGNTQVNNIEYVQIMTTGNSIDFGDLTESRKQAAGVSNGHGGLG